MLTISPERSLIKLGDNITTDDITPAGTWLKYRSNVPKYSESVFCGIDADFHLKAQESRRRLCGRRRELRTGLVAREHAALCPMFLGIKAVIAKSFARIHKDNLINFGILPLTFASPVKITTPSSDGDELGACGYSRRPLFGYHYACQQERMVKRCRLNARLYRQAGRYAQGRRYGSTTPRPRALNRSVILGLVL